MNPERQPVPNMQAEASRLLQIGWSVIPMGGKAPFMAWREFQSRHPSQEEITGWWSRWPTANVGIVTGRVSGIVVLDVDSLEAQRLIQSHGPTPDTPIARSGRADGGMHLYFRFPEMEVRTITGLFRGLDLKAEGGVVVAPPSLHPTSGHRYRWIKSPWDVDPAPLPEWVLAAVRARQTARSSAPHVDGTDHDPGWWLPLLQGVPEGQRHDAALRIAGHYLALGWKMQEVEALLLGFAVQCVPPLDPKDVRRIVRDLAQAQEAKRQVVGATPVSQRDERNPWIKARPAPDFLGDTDDDADWLDRPVIASGSITELFSPRGLGKTHYGHAIGVRLAQTDKRVLLLDRDNSRRELRRRLRAWGAADIQTLKVMTRDEVPPLTDAEAWRAFPFRDYDLIIIDSLDATTEGVGEKDSAKPSRALAPLLDLARRAGGPAVLVLGNTVKTAEHGRGSGVVEDRADICFEVRDATDLRPTGTKPWWQELPPGGAGAWAERASRRKRRSRYRLAFVSSKFRVGEEPDPFILEIDLSGERWTSRDVTAEVVAAAEATRSQAEQERQQRLDAAARALIKEIEVHAEANSTLLADKDAIPFLMDHGLKRAEARQLLRELEGKAWRTQTLADHRGRPKGLFPANPQAAQELKGAAEINTPQETPQSTRSCEGPISADRMNTGRRKSRLPESASDARFRDPHLFPPTVVDTGSEPLDQTPMEPRRTPLLPGGVPAAPGTSPVRVLLPKSAPAT